jgi:thioredoxin-related protein
MMFAKSHLVLTAFILVSSSLETLGAATWFDDLSRAQAQARAQGKFVLVNFTGSDWCGWCIKLRKEVFLKPEFESYAASNLVLLEIDFPRRKALPPSVQQNNHKLAERFQVQGYPTLIVLDSQGRKLGRVSYGTGGPKQFISEVEQLIHPRAEVGPTNVPARKAGEPQRPGKASAAAETNRADLKLQRIMGSKQRRRAVINDRAFSVGETVVMRLPAGNVKVQCVEIRERSVIVTIDRQRSRHELRLSAGT